MDHGWDKDDTHCTGRRRATILGLGVAVPEHVWLQKSFPDYYFEITNCNHMMNLKDTFKNICEKTMIEKRHVYMSDDLLRRNPCITAYKAPSLDLRQELANATVPELGSAAARAAIQDWGRQASDVTHLVFCTTVSGCMPGADFELVKLLGLPLSTKRFMLYQAGCHGGGIALRLAKDLAENNPGARVLVASSEVSTLLAFGGPDEDHLDALVATALFGDGAGAAVIGAGDPTPVERPIFYMASASQATLPGTERALYMQLGRSGLDLGISAEVPALLRGTIKGCVADMLAPLGLPVVPGAGWNGVFWAVHPGGRAILDSCEAALGLEAGKLAASRHVLSEYGNMLGSTIFFVLDEVRRRRQEGDCEWGLTLGIGPGVTVEMMVLQSASSQD